MARVFGWLLAALLLCEVAAAADSPTLERIAETGRFTIGYVPDAPPLSFHDAGGKPVGYSIDLCKRVATAVQAELGLENLDIVYQPLVAPAERLRAVETGKVDIECGATTVTLSRRERVDFSLMTYITGGAVLSRNETAIPTTAAMIGKRIAVIEGTTTEAALKMFIDVNEGDVVLHPIATHDEGMAVLKAGEVDGYASDRTMLIGQAMRSTDGARYGLTRDVFSFEPYALMVRRGDTEFRLVVDRALAGLYRSARIQRIYSDWFGRLGERMTPIVKAMYEFQAVGE